MWCWTLVKEVLMRTIACLLFVLSIAIQVLAGDPDGQLGANDRSLYAEVVRSAERSEVVVIGRVSDVTAIYANASNAIHSIVTLDVSRVLKGVEQFSIAFRVTGGELDGVLASCGAAPLFATGDTCMVFLEGDENDRYWCRGTAAFRSRGKWLSRARLPFAVGDVDLESVIRKRIEGRGIHAAMRRAPLVVEGSVVSAEVIVDHIPMELHVTLHALALWKGSVSVDSLRILEHTRRFYGWHDIPAFGVGERVVVALAPNTDGTYRLVGGVGGKAHKAAGRGVRNGSVQTWHPG